MHHCGEHKWPKNSTTMIYIFVRFFLFVLQLCHSCTVSALHNNKVPGRLKIHSMLKKSDSVLYGLGFKSTIIWFLLSSWWSLLIKKTKSRNENYYTKTETETIPVSEYYWAARLKIQFEYKLLHIMLMRPKQYKIGKITLKIQ